MAPLERLGRPEDIAEGLAFLAFLARPGGQANGQTLWANGGTSEPPPERLVWRVTNSLNNSTN